jgi:alpha-mannosidase
MKPSALIATVLVILLSAPKAAPQGITNRVLADLSQLEQTHLADSALAAEVREIRTSLLAGRMLTTDPQEFLSGKPFAIDISTTPRKRLARLRQVLDAAAGKIDLAALRGGDKNTFLRSVQAARQALAPVSAFAKEYTLYLAGNAHIDMAWLWRWRETIEVCRATFEQQLQLMDEFPDYTFTQSQMQAYRWMEEKYPDLFARIKQRVAEGRWEVTGGMVVEPDCNLLSGESWVRQFLYGKRYAQSRFGVDIDLGWNVDSFGYTWNMPQFLTRAGVRAFITQKISWNDTNEFPYHLFWWEAPDGSRILTYFPFSGYVNTAEAERMLRDLKLSEANTGLKKVLFLYGIGDHGGGPNREMLERIMFYKTCTVFPKIQFSKASDFIAGISEEEKARLPVWRDELYLEYHRGVYTTQAAIKKANRRNEHLLTDAEKLASLAYLAGGAYPSKSLREAWWKLAFNQFHDILPGSGIPAIYRDALEDYAEIRQSGKRVIRKSLDFLSADIDTRVGDGAVPLLVWNTLAWERTGVVKVELPETMRQPLAVEEIDGSVVPSQVVQRKEGNQLLFVARGVPSLGYKLYRLVPGKAAKTGDGVTVSGAGMENRFLRVEVDPVSGLITRIYDRRNKREVLAPGRPGNLLQLLEDIPDAFDAWNIKYTGREWTLEKADSIRVLERGPVRATIRVYHSFLGETKARRFPTSDYPSSFFVQDISLYQDLPWVEVRMEADWWETHLLLKTAFPVGVQNDWATFEIPYATIQRRTTRNNSWEAARFEVSALHWADLTDEDGSFGVSLLNDSKYGYDVLGNVMRLTLLRSPTYPDPTADRGKHRFSYALYPHAGDWRAGQTIRRGYEFNVPLIARLVQQHPGERPPQFSFVRVEPANIILSAIKRAEEGDGLVVRLFESEGRDTKARVTFFTVPTAAFELDLMENKLRRLTIDGRSIAMPVRKLATTSVLVSFQSRQQKSGVQK